MMNRGPPHYKPKMVKEESLPEPQLIKRTYLECFFAACRELAEINRLKRFNKNSPKREAMFQKLVQELFLQISMKDCIREWDKFDATLDKIIKGSEMSETELRELLIKEGEILQEMGPLRIEYLKSVAPEYAYMEDDLLGED